MIQTNFTRTTKTSRRVWVEPPTSPIRATVFDKASFRTDIEIELDEDTEQFISRVKSYLFTCYPLSDDGHRGELTVRWY